MSETLVVAEITKDHIWREDDPVDSLVGKEFHHDAMQDWWGWEDEVPVDTDMPVVKTKFKLYDDDDELYYEGWLLNDEWCIVQSFVLKWAEVDSGCTTILVYKDSEAGYVQEIG